MAEDKARWDLLIGWARAFIGELVRGDATAASARLNEHMRTAMPGDKIKEIWLGVVRQAGAYQEEETDNVRTAVEQGYECVYLRCKFAKVPLALKVVFQGDQIAGFQLLPVGP
jgi:hypothetical protein